MIKRIDGFIWGFVALILLFLTLPCHSAGIPTQDSGYTSFQYETSFSSGINNITWDRKVQKVVIVQVSTHTVYIDPFSVIVASAPTGGHTDASHTIDTAVVGAKVTAGDMIILDSNTANKETTLNVESNDFCLFVSTASYPTDGLIDIKVTGWGW